MQVAKWGNSLAIRLPAAVVKALELKVGDEVEIQIAGQRSLEIEKAELFAAKEERLRQAGVEVATVANGLETADPWGTRVRLVKV